MRRDRHKFYLEAFSVMAPVAWQGSTPASNSGPELLLPAGAGGEELFCHHLCPATGILPEVGEEFACASKGMAMHGIKPHASPFPGMYLFPPTIPAQQPLSWAPQGWVSSQLHSTAHPRKRGWSGEDATNRSRTLVSLKQRRAGGSKALPPP